MRWVFLMVTVLVGGWSMADGSRRTSVSDGEKDGEKPGLHVLGRARADVGNQGVSGGAPDRPWRVDPRGRPVVSPAGFVELEPSGDLLRQVWSFEARAKVAERYRKGGLGQDAWGHVEAMRRVLRIARAWRKAHPNGPRLIIEDVSSPLAGFPDRDGDGLADHVTHQLGLNVNFLLPVRGKEGEAWLGRDGGDEYDPAAGQELLRLLFEEGAMVVTTSALTRVLDHPKPLGLPFELIKTNERGEQRYRAPTGQRLILLAGANHGNHFNARFTPQW